MVLDEVLSLAQDPQAALDEALRVLRPAGQLLILDRILPAALRLPSRAAQRVLYENQLTVMLREAGLEVDQRRMVSRPLTRVRVNRCGRGSASYQDRNR